MALLLWLLIPLGVGAGISLAFGGRDGPQPVAQVFIVDEDRTFFSRLLAGAINQASGIMRAEEVELAAGRARIEKGEGSALLIIPKGFGEAVLRETPARLTLITNPEQTILPGIVEESLEVFADGVFYIHRVFGDELRMLAAGPPAGSSTFPDVDVARLSVSFNQAVQRLQTYLFPPAIDLQTTSAGDAQPQQRPMTLTMLFLPGIVMMSLLFMAQGLSADVWQERAQGTLRRAACAPPGLVTMLLGKMLAWSALILLVAMVILALGMFYLALPLSRLPAALAWSVFSGLAFLLLMLLIQLHATSQRAASILTNSIVFPLLMLGGSMFPTEVMPRWMNSVNRFIPNAWALERLKDILFDRADAASLLAAFSGLSALGLVAFLLSMRRLRRAFAWSQA